MRLLIFLVLTSAVCFTDAVTAQTALNETYELQGEYNDISITIKSSHDCLSSEDTSTLKNNNILSFLKLEEDNEKNLNYMEVIKAHPKHDTKNFKLILSELFNSEINTQFIPEDKNCIVLGFEINS